ncbi:MAG: preprotein translocase subunit YajC [Taibaiella sp.]|jgi:preprotein translocase subunit YajC
MTTTFASIMLQAQPGGGAMMPIMLVGMIVVMYFFMIRPQQKRAKEQKKFAESMNTGEKVITTSGIHGRIVRTNEDGTIALEIDRNTTITVERQSISMEMTLAYQKKQGLATSVTAGVK